MTETLEKPQERRLMPIGAVTRLTGINDHTLRKWESRYALVVPTRTDTGRRLYTEADVERLVLVRDLLEQGYQPSQLAEHSTDNLRALRETPATPRRDPGGPVELTVIGAMLSATLRIAGLPPELASVRVFDGTLEDWLAGIEIGGNLAIEVASLQPGLARRIAERQARRSGTLVLVYGFANGRTLAKLTASGVVCRKAPVTAGEIIDALTGDDRRNDSIRALLDQPPPARRLSDAQVGRLARRSTAIECECPSHVAELLLAINGFEQYSRDCMDTDPGQADLHRYLERAACTARAVIEAAAEHLAEVEGIDLDEAADDAA